ncbi:MAG: hypothetical protein Q7U10_01485 [Thermodesulfovibrionia bacterium]|nr:hypothetical protein [Thermodesulfovibrionia bacterium]
MEKNLFTSNFNKLPKGFIIALILILLLELVNFTFDNYFYNPHMALLTGLQFKIKNEIALSEENNFDLLILGDSHSLNGFIPRVIEENTGLRSFNFALSGNQKLIGYYLIFKNYIKAHSTKPKYVVIGFVPYTTYPVTKSDYSKDAINHLASLKNGNVREFIEEFGIVQGVKYIFPSLKHQARFKDFIKAPFSFNFLNKAQINEVVKQIYDGKGYYPHPGEKRIYNSDRVNERFMDEYNSFSIKDDVTNLTISPFSYKYLKAILDLAKENNITPIYYVPVFPPVIYDEFKKYVYFKELDEFLDSLKKEYPELIVFYAQNILNENNMYKDIYHLTSEGAVVLSEALSNKVNEIE